MWGLGHDGWPQASLLKVAELARAQGWTVVGAIHSHPGIDVEHSSYDDEMIHPNYNGAGQLICSSVPAQGKTQSNVASALRNKGCRAAK
jgi:proteasome lid subunit RPN8/RPN11